MEKINSLPSLKKYWFILCLFFPLLINAQLSDFAEVDFHKADSIAGYYHDEDLNDLPLLANKLTKGLFTDIEKFRSIYFWICTNIENDYPSSRKNLINREYYKNDSLKLAEWNRKYSKVVMRKLIEEKKTLCTGYAFLLRELCTKAGIPCRIIDGYARTASTHIGEAGIPNHSWNAVYLQGKWYVCDPTWSSGITYKYAETTSFVQEFNEGYFLCHPEFFIKTHYPLDTAWTLLQNFYDMKQFVNAPILYSHAFKHGVNPLSPDSLNLRISKKDSLNFTYQILREIEPKRIYIELSSGPYRSVIIEPDIISYKKGLLKLRCVFYKRGLFDLHFKIDDQVISSYTVRVHK